MPRYKNDSRLAPPEGAGQEPITEGGPESAPDYASGASPAAPGPSPIPARLAVINDRLKALDAEKEDLLQRKRQLEEEAYAARPKPESQTDALRRISKILESDDRARAAADANRFRQLQQNVADLQGRLNRRPAA